LLFSPRMREPTWGTKARPARMRLEGLKAPLRAMAREQDGDGVILEAELPWLTLGSVVTTEMEPGRAVTGRIKWVGLDVTRRGAARLRILVAEEDGVPPVEKPRPEARKRRGHTAAFAVFAVALVLTLVCGTLAFAFSRVEPRFLRSTEAAAPSSSHPPTVRLIPHQKSAPPHRVARRSK
jgi:hypothetical protein